MKPLPSLHHPSAGLVLMSLAFLVLSLRLPLLTDQPYTDEGIYAAAGYFQYITYTGALPEAGALLPREGHLSLYPLLTSWVHALPWQPLLSLRLIDALVAVGAMCSMARVLEIVSGDRRAAWVGALFLTLALNHALFINAGFKNSLMPALWLMALALLRLLQLRPPGAAAAGGFMALAVLFREFFLPFALLMALLAWHRGGFVAFLRYGVAGLAAGVVCVSLLVGLRGDGGMAGLIAAYTGFAGNIEPLAQRLDATRAHGLNSARLLLPLLPWAIAGLTLPLWARWARAPGPASAWLLALALTAAPTLEIAYKSAFPYHFSTIAIGASMLVALCLTRLKGRVVAVLLGITAVALVPGYAREQLWSAGNAARFAPVMLQQQWQSAAAQDSLYLRAAAIVRQRTPSDARLMTETSAAVVFPLTGRLPARVAMGDVSRVAQRRSAEIRAVETAELKAAPPDVLVLVPRGPQSANVPPLARELAADYPNRLLLPPGLRPYGAWSTEIYWR